LALAARGTNSNSALSKTADMILYIDTSNNGANFRPCWYYPKPSMLYFLADAIFNNLGFPR